VNNSQWLPRINADACTGCGECIAICPTGSLQMRDGKAVLANPATCIYCATCETICPVGAIELPYLVCIANQRGDNHS
jgi:formate hydrogenlyase subunit 6